MRTVRLQTLLFVVTLAALSALAAGVLIGRSGFGPAQADGDNAIGEIRAAARLLDDGRVEVALQQRGGQAAWSDRQLPDARFLGADAEPGVWRVSSAVDIEDTTRGPLFCLIGHGDPDDTFWREIRGYARIAADRFDMNLRYSTHQQSSDQAAAVRQCSTDGAFAIASTIADPAVMTPALREAAEAGVRIVTFNSGAAFAAEAGSAVHIALNDEHTGQLAAQRFNQLEVSGLLLCVIHEETNVGLNQRCDNLAAGYQGGEVEVLQLSDGDDIPIRAEKIVARLSDAEAGRIAGIFVLNPDTLVAANTAIEQTDSRLVVMTVGADSRNRIFPDWVQRQRPLSLTDLAEFQGYLTVAALQMMADFAIPSGFILSPALFIGEPNVIDTFAWSRNTEEALEASRAVEEIMGEIEDDE